MRPIIFAFFAIVAYTWRCSHPAKPIAGLSLPLRLFLLTLTVLFASTVYLHSAVTRAVFDLMSIDAAAIGVFLGVALADQIRPSRTQVSRPAGGTGPGRSTVEGESTGWLAGLGSVAASASSNLIMLSLTIYALFPATIWSPLLQRFQGLKAPGIELQLGPATGSRTADALRTAVRPSAPQGIRDVDVESRGFSSFRLAQMKAMSYRSADDPRLGECKGGDLESEEKPTDILFGSVHSENHGGNEKYAECENGRTDRSFYIRKERAYLAHFMMGQKAFDSRFEESSISAERTSAMKKAIISLKQFADGQDRVLFAIGPTISCISEIINTTNDRLLIRYRLSGALEALVNLTHAWNKTEHYFATTPERRTEKDDEKILKLKNEIINELRNLQNMNTVFAIWSKTFYDKLIFNEAESRWKPTDCEFPDNLHSLYDLAAQISLDTDTFKNLFIEGKVAPYLSIFSAYALSAAGDHAAGVWLLKDWLEKLAKSEKIARQTRTQSSACDRPLFCTWLRMRAVSEMLQIQLQSAGEPGEVPPTEDGYRYLLEDIFPSLFGIIGQSIALKEWMIPATKECLSLEYKWRQRLVYAYVSNWASYLRFQASTFVTPNDVSPQHLEFSDLLVKLNPQCLPDALSVTQAEQYRADAYITSASIWMNELVAGRLKGEARLALRRRLDTELEASIRIFERLADPSSSSDAQPLDIRAAFAAFGRRVDPQLLIARSLRSRLAQLDDLD